MFNRNIFTILLILLLQSAYSQNAIVINEICNNPPLEFDTEDWVELYNNGSSTVNLNGWQLKDDDDTHVFAFPNISITAQGYLIICRDLAAFENLRPGITAIGDLDFGLSGDGDCVRLYNASGQTVDEVCYEEVAPWPKANLGRTLGLTDPNLDNSIGSNWQLIGDNGTPGAANVFSSILQAPAYNTALIYPNPVVGETINVSIAKNQISHITFFNPEGKQISLEILSRNDDNVKLRVPQALANGIYYLKIEQAGHSYLNKIIISR